MRAAPSTIRLLGGLAGISLFGCGGDDLLLPSAGHPAQLRLVSGDLQQAVTGARLPEPLVVEALDGTGRPVVGSRIVFRFVASTAGARVNPDTAQTNGSGLAVAEVRLGETPGLHPVEALVVDGPGGLVVRFALTALAPPGGGGGGGGGGGEDGGDDDGGFGGGGGGDDDDDDADGNDGGGGGSGGVDGGGDDDDDGGDDDDDDEKKGKGNRGKGGKGSDD